MYLMNLLLKASSNNKSISTPDLLVNHMLFGRTTCTAPVDVSPKQCIVALRHQMQDLHTTMLL